jgi:hypothetical protein
MKSKFLSTVFLMSLFLITKSQGNLQFNQVINIINGTSYTVPSGKVLKIESINFNSPTTSVAYSSCMINCPSCGASSGVTCYYSGKNYLVIDNNIYSANTPNGFVYINSGGSCSVCPSTQSVGVSAISFNLPIWLRDGKIVNVQAAGIFISAIEFNIIP